MEPIIFSDDEALDYIRALENPNKIGWDKKKRVALFLFNNTMS